MTGNTGIVFDIQKFCLNDGPGIRTTVFLKGCPLKCVWCHNPESQAKSFELMFRKDKCLFCGKCVSSCKRKCHGFENGEHVFQREKCVGCFSCVTVGCDALKRVGREVTLDEVLSEALKDKIFYEQSGGGITLSGGEPLFQTDFSIELLKKAKENGLHTAIETCGYASKNDVERIAEYADLILFDYKETDGKSHERFTGVDNSVILENLSLLNSLNKEIVLRCPIVPGCNDRDDHFLGIATVANKFKQIRRIELEPYHSLGEGKYACLDKPLATFRQADETERKRYQTAIAAETDKPVVFA